MITALYRLIIWLRLGRALPRCNATPPWRLMDAGLCICPRGHERENRDDADWHADGTGYIWNATRWGWAGPILSLADVHRELLEARNDGWVPTAKFSDWTPE